MTVKAHTPLRAVPAAAPGPDRTLSTGEVARFCQVAARTASQWFDNGLLKGYRLPGRGLDRRIYADDLVAFMRKHGLRVPPELEQPSAVVLFALHDVVAPHGARSTPSLCELGVIAATERLVAAVLGDDDGLASAIEGATVIRARHPECRILFVVSPDADAERIKVAGFGDCPVAARPIAAERIPQMLAAG